MKKLICLALSLIIVFSVAAIGVAATNEINSRGTLKGEMRNGTVKSVDIPIGKQMNLSGVSVAEKFNIFIDKFWDVKRADLNLYYTRSNLQIPYNCSLTVYINGNPIYSVALKNNVDETRKLIKIPMKIEYLKEGINDITIKMYMRISDEDCTDDINAANWITFHPESFIHYEVVEQSLKNSISNFPFPFVKASELKEANSIIMLADAFKGSELTTAMWIESSLTKNKAADIFTPVVKYSDAQKQEKEIIYIGNLDNSPKEIIELLDENQKKLASDSVVLKIANSPYNPNKRILCVISNKSDILEKAGRFLVNMDLTKQALEDSVIINDKLDVLTKKTQDISRKSFEELGYGDVDLKGPARQQYTFGVNLPKNRIVQLGSKIYIQFRYSKNLDFTKSLVTLYINGKPVTSKKLSIENADDDSFEIQMPKGETNKYYYEFKIAFDLEMPNIDCGQRLEETPWALICKDSFVELSHVDNKNYIFETYPSPFVKENQFNDVLMIVPEDTNSKDLTSAASIIALMSKDILINDGEFRAKRSSEFEDKSKDKDSNLIIIGTPERNKLVQKINSNLWVAYMDDFTAYKSNEKKVFLENYAANIATAQIIISPFNKEKAALVVTSPKEDLVYAATKYLCDETLFSKVLGDSVIIERGGQNQNFYFKGKDKLPNIEKPKFAIVNTNVKALLIFFILVIALFVLTIVLYFKKFRER